MPEVEHVVSVVARLAGTETSDEMALQLQQNPLSYLHIVIPNMHFGEMAGTNGQHYQLAHSYFKQMKEQGVVRNLNIPSIFVYKQTLPDGHSFCGLVCTVSAIDYLEDSVKKHENTITEKEARLVEHIAGTKLVGEPVLLSMPHGEELELGRCRNGLEHPAPSARHARLQIPWPKGQCR